ncbi:cysteine desulfurase family protein [Flaviflagellibacter deserti]|uniref:Cysteine desulfurase n=1 Tax=Flaviflagellibacter deserti TaxID=2267266 RepID=A0ABV9Z4E1_9HYPH
MTMTRIYLDHNATAPIRPEAARAVGRALVQGGNPSSIHTEGRKARATIERAREDVAALVGAQPKNVFFTSGATEALNLALTPSLQAGCDARPWRLYVSATEHAAVLMGHRFPEDAVEIVPVKPNGVIDLDALAKALEQHEYSRPLLALQIANNETGVIQPVKAAAELIHGRDGLVVSDAVQAAGRMPVDIETCGADLIAISAHKIGGPSGAGALIRRKEAIHIGEPLVRGGGQEKGLRAGTENLASIAGFGAAAEAIRRDLAADVSRLESQRERLESGIFGIAQDVVVFGAAAERIPNTVAFAVPGVVAETALISFDLAGVAISSGSACSSGKVKNSHVLDAMGVKPDIRACMLRVSLGWTTSDADIERFLEVFAQLRANTSVAGKVLAA